MTKHKTERKVLTYNALPFGWDEGDGRRVTHFVTVQEAAFIRSKHERRVRRVVMWILTLAFSLALVALALLLGGAL